MPILSVIIPTHKRPEILHRCLEHLSAQTIAREIEVIVVSDGHDEESAEVVKCASARPDDSVGRAQVQCHYYEVEKSHQGVARNRGVAAARGEYILFIGDDIFLAPDACEIHVAASRPLPGAEAPAVLGFTTWDPACGITPVMWWLECSGWQFGYPSLERYAHRAVPRSVQHRYTYTSHISVPLHVAKKFPFRTDVHLYGWEDIEWGMRLRDAGVPLVYEPGATALHHHHITLADSLKRMETLGRSAVEIQKKVPGFDRVPRGWKLLAYRILALLPTMAGRHRRAFLRGISRV